MMSFLAVRSAAMGATFLQKHPGPWLVWEPGNWHVPQEGTPAQKQTLVGWRTDGAPPKGDALCFQLKLPPGSDVLRVGRDAGNNVVLNDATVSREHLLLTPADGGAWEAEPAKDRVVQVGGQPLPQGRRTRLRSGSQLVLGGVTLTYYDAAGMAVRLKSQP